MPSLEPVRRPTKAVTRPAPCPADLTTVVSLRAAIPCIRHVLGRHDPCMPFGMATQDPQRRTRADWLQLALLQVALLLAVAFAAAGPSHAHGGSLDKHGCHHDRKNGGYHCHRASTSSAAPSRPVVAPSSLAPARAAPADRAPVGRAFANCAEARAAGAAPVYRGDPGYGPHLDRDNDGIGCEPYRGR